MFWITLLVALLLAGVHLVAGKIRFLEVVPRSTWLSAAGGIGVGYVFVHLLPEAEAHGRRLRETGVLDGAWLGWIEAPVYFVALLGLVLFYGLERWVVARRDGDGSARERRDNQEQSTLRGVFWLHIASFGLYNLLIAYLLVRESEWAAGALAAYAIAMGLHLLVNDFGLHQHHKELYRQKGRWILAAAVPVGWAIGAATPIHPAATAILFGFLCGALLLNTLKEELPAERESNYVTFVIGALATAGLLLLV